MKHRESFRPFGVAVREEDCARYFEGSQLCRFMNSLAAVRAKANFLPHALQLPGGLVRLHIVEKETNRVLWELLGRFGEHEPAPILVNTSFNLPGEPPVVRPRDAVRTFFCSGTDAVFASQNRCDLRRAGALSSQTGTRLPVCQACGFGSDNQHLEEL